MLAKEQVDLDTYGYPFPPDSRRRWRKHSTKAARSLLGKCIYLALSIAGSMLSLGRLGRAQPALEPATFHPRRILVIRLDLIGDLVLTLPMVQALKHTYPGAEIDLLATPASAQVVLHDPNLSQIITYDPNIWRRPRALVRLKNWRDARNLLRRLRSRHYDLAISVYAQWAAVLAVLSGAKRRVGYRQEGYPGFMTDPVPRGIPARRQQYEPLDRKHEVDYCLELARVAGATLTPEDRTPHLYIDEQSRREVERMLDDAGVSPGEPVIICHVGSNNGQSKRWPIPYWATLIDRLVREDRARVVLTGASGDLPIIESVLRRTREPAINLAGKTSLPQLTALLWRADLVISGDSGPMHIAEAVDARLIAIFGPTNPARYAPVSPGAIILRSHIWCSPCYNAKDPADCPFYTTQCMKNILPATVLAAARKNFNPKRVEQS
ncbi:MAG TPA: lipopolysaccharide heptosyltransferase II [Ktedonobacteraceae bacterium]|jgi:lipopolysaccharide heptosyltransferase II|nr:lipopolysaccharide heptosyltransferase II [Ktedonobacteraceae bacterium]